MNACFSAGERRILESLAATSLPKGQILPAAGASTISRLETWFAGQDPLLIKSYRGLLWSLELSTVPRRLAKFSALSFSHRLDTLDSWERQASSRLALRALLTPLKLAYFDDPTVYRALGCRYAVDPPQNTERPRWRSQVIDAGSLSNAEMLECDAVVVGTGAGGAPVAKALADQGFAVLMIEEGAFYDRKDLTGRPIEMMQKLYRNGGLTTAFGNSAIPIPVGRAVGGTTLINSGTCFRVPRSTLLEWRESSGLSELTEEALAPFYLEVEKELGVAPSTASAIGAPGRIIARGCDALGYQHQPLLRNAPDCDGQGLCCFGCPTEAKRSTNVSFVPAALMRGAQLVTGLKVERILVENETAVGVAGVAAGQAGPVSVSVRAKVVVLACGALHTPVLLQRNGLANASGQLGRNLSIHPASSAIGLFAERVDGSRTVPQGYAIDHFRQEGILFEGAMAPLDLTAVSLATYGPAYVALMEKYDRALGFGFMVKDRSRGRVRPGRGQEPLITYWMGEADFKSMQRAMGILARVFFAAGASEVFPPVAGFERLFGLKDVERFERASLSPREMDISAYHPLGTARMGKHALSSVVGTTHETWDVHNLYICDGSSLPGSAGVNPQLTIMALALRASTFIARRLERLHTLDATTFTCVESVLGAADRRSRFLAAPAAGARA